MNPAQCFLMLWLRELLVSPGCAAHAAQPSCWRKLWILSQIYLSPLPRRVFNISRHGGTDSISRRRPKQSPFPCLSYLAAHRWSSIFPSFLSTSEGISTSQISSPPAQSTKQGLSSALTSLIPMAREHSDPTKTAGSKHLPCFGKFS